MESYKKQFLDISLESKALKFGEFTLKSGRISPYFFNLGLIAKAQYLNVLAESYASKIIEQKLKFDVIFGPAYKGISIAAIVAIKLFELGGKDYADVEFAYNRKEKKDHGEGGNLVGPNLAGKSVLIVDDVMTAGTAINEAYDILQGAGAKVAGIIISLDRQEIAPGSTVPTTVAVSKRFGVPVLSIVCLDDIILYLEKTLEPEQLAKIKEYKSKYGASV